MTPVTFALRCGWGGPPESARKRRGVPERVMTDLSRQRDSAATAAVQTTPGRLDDEPTMLQVSVAVTETDPLRAVSGERRKRPFRVARHQHGDERRRQANWPQKKHCRLG